MSLLKQHLPKIQLTLSTRPDIEIPMKHVSAGEYEHFVNEINSVVFKIHTLNQELEAGKAKYEKRFKDKKEDEEVISQESAAEATAILNRLTTMLIDFLCKYTELQEAEVRHTEYGLSFNEIMELFQQIRERVLGGQTGLKA